MRFGAITTARAAGAAAPADRAVAGAGALAAQVVAGAVALAAQVVAGEVLAEAGAGTAITTGGGTARGVVRPADLPAATAPRADRLAVGVPAADMAVRAVAQAAGPITTRPQKARSIQGPRFR